MDPLLYHAHHTLRSEDLPFWRDLSLQTSGKVLELGCGTGRVMLRLVKDQIMVTGLDNDSTMLAFVRQSVPPQLGHFVEIHEADMRDFSLAEQFSLIILPCNTLSIFKSADRSKIFQAAKKHLAPDGVFAFSIPNTLVLADLPEIGEEELEDEFAHPSTNYPVHVYSSWERSTDRMSFYWRYDHVFPDGHIVKAVHHTTHYLDPPQAYIAELKACGLKPFAAYGDFFREKFEPDSSYFIVLARSV